ncbi:MAG: hypothetical protein KAQ70_06495, partial [Candidatus Heimdallarchaeota archaeon]|nr:hypothetical protein [Candidatus Heimdallarchaeota archaeon]
MKLQFKRYNHEFDFNRVRNFYIDNHETVFPSIWTFERWNYMIYFIRDMFEFSIEKIEDEIGLWENEHGNIVGIVTNEAVGRGEAFIHLHPDYYEKSVLQEMFELIEEKYAVEIEGKVIIKLRILDGDTDLEKYASERGYDKNPDAVETTSLLLLNKELEFPEIPDGYRIQSMA